MDRYIWVIYDKEDNAQYTERYAFEDDALNGIDELAYKFERDASEFGVRVSA